MEEKCANHCGQHFRIGPKWLRNLWRTRSLAILIFPTCLSLNVWKKDARGLVNKFVENVMYGFVSLSWLDVFIHKPITIKSQEVFHCYYWLISFKELYLLRSHDLVIRSLLIFIWSVLKWESLIKAISEKLPLIKILGESFFERSSSFLLVSPAYLPSSILTKLCFVCEQERCLWLTEWSLITVMNRLRLKDFAITSYSLGNPVAITSPRAFCISWAQHHRRKRQFYFAQRKGE